MREEEIDARIALLYGAPTRFAIDAANAAILAANQNNALANAGGPGAPGLVVVPVAAVGNPGVLPDDYVHQIYRWLINVRTPTHEAQGAICGTNGDTTARKSASLQSTSS